MSEASGSDGTGRNSPASPSEQNSGGNPRSEPSTVSHSGEARMELPSWNRSRSKRKANIKADAVEDVFQRGIKRSGIFAIDRVHWVLLGLLAGGALVAGILYWRDTQVEAEAESSRLLANAAALVSRGKILAEGEEIPEGLKLPHPVYKDAGEREQSLGQALRKIDEVGSETAGKLAELVQAAQALRRNEPELALQQYDAFLSKVDADHPLYSLAQLGRGVSLEDKGDRDSALAQYQKVAGKPGDFDRDTGLWHQGRLLEQMGKNDEAIAAFRQILEEFAGKSQWEPLAKARVEKLKGGESKNPEPSKKSDQIAPTKSAQDKPSQDKPSQDKP